MRIVLSLFLFITASQIFAQENDYQLGVSTNQKFNNQGAYYDYSDPGGLNIKVSVWGYVKFPGRYIIPYKSNINDLISYAGGISDNSNIDDIRLYRVESDSTQKMYKFNYNDLWWSESLQNQLDLSRVKAGDILIIPGRPRFYLENYISLALGVVTTLVSIATLIITINK